MPNVLVNIAKMTSTTTGTGTLTLGSAVTGYLSFAGAGVTNGQVVTYVIEDFDGSGNIDDREVGAGTYTATGTTLSRDTVYSSTNSGNRINCSGTQQVLVALSKQDIDTLAAKDVANTFTADQILTTTVGPTSTGSLGFRGAPQNERTGGTTYTLALDDAGKVIYKADNTAQSWQIPLNASIAFPIGTCIMLDNTNAGNTTATNVDITRASGVTLIRGDAATNWNVDGNRRLPRGNTGTLRKIGTNAWVITGTTGLINL